MIWALYRICYYSTVLPSIKSYWPKRYKMSLRQMHFQSSMTLSKSYCVCVDCEIWSFLPSSSSLVHTELSSSMLKMRAAWWLWHLKMFSEQFSLSVSSINFWDDQQNHSLLRDLLSKVDELWAMPSSSTALKWITFLNFDTYSNSCFLSLDKKTKNHSTMWQLPCLASIERPCRFLDYNGMKISNICILV